MLDLCVCPHLMVQGRKSFYLEHAPPPLSVCYIDLSAQLVTWQPLVSVNHLRCPTVKYLNVYSGPLYSRLGTREPADPLKQLFASGKNSHKSGFCIFVTCRNHIVT